MPTCNICNSTGFRLAPATAAGPICGQCGSSVRFRHIAKAVTKYVFSSDLPLSEVAPRRDLRGAGLSDFTGYAKLLEQKSGYRNTFFHQEPRLDITHVTATQDLNFLISSDVFEHVAPPVSRAFVGAFSLLAPGGVLILSVPVGSNSQTLEHFPRAFQYKTVELGGTHLLVNKTTTGQIELYADLRFHGGPGTTLEFRIFSREHVLAELRAAGFEAVEELGQEYPEHNIVNLARSSRVFVAFRSARH